MPELLDSIARGKSQSQSESRIAKQFWNSTMNNAELYAFMHVFKHSSMETVLYASLKVCKNARMLACKYESMQFMQYQDIMAN